MPGKTPSGEVKNYLVGTQAAIYDAIACIDKSGVQIALVVDENGRLTGTLTDGDIRRALLRNLPLTTRVTEIMTREPRMAPAGSDDTMLFRLMRALRIRHLPLVDEEGRVTGLRTLEGLLQNPRRTNRVVLMAGGLGSRLRPLTHALPKPMLPVGGKPLLETILETFVDQGFYRFSISLNYLAETIIAHFGDGARWGVEIEYLQETARMGTAGSLSLLKERPDEPILVMNGDILTSVDFRQMLQFHQENGALGTMALHEYRLQVPYGVVEINGHRVVGITEKPTHHHFINAGIYVLDPSAYDLIPQDRYFDMPDLFQTLIREGHTTVAFPIREYWLDIGQPQDLQRAETEFSSVFPPNGEER
ncbi:MAG: nucleotidyltransferase family protein [Rhodospirillaceae bacterium]